MISVVFVVAFGIASALWLVFAAALKWRLDAGLSRLLNRLASPLCFAPPALLLAAIALFLAHYPYARSIAEIHSCKQLAYGYIPIVLALVQF